MAVTNSLTEIKDLEEAQTLWNDSRPIEKKNRGRIKKIYNHSCQTIYGFLLWLFTSKGRISQWKEGDWKPLNSRSVRWLSKEQLLSSDFNEMTADVVRKFSRKQLSRLAEKNAFEKCPDKVHLLYFNDAIEQLESSSEEIVENFSGDQKEALEMYFQYIRFPAPTTEKGELLKGYKNDPGSINFKVEILPHITSIKDETATIHPDEITSFEHLLKYVTNSTKLDFEHQSALKLIFSYLRSCDDARIEELISWLTSHQNFNEACLLKAIIALNDRDLCREIETALISLLKIFQDKDLSTETHNNVLNNCYEKLKNASQEDETAKHVLPWLSKLFKPPEPDKDNEPKPPPEPIDPTDLLHYKAKILEALEKFDTFVQHINALSEEGAKALILDALKFGSYGPEAKVCTLLVEKKFDDIIYDALKILLAKDFVTSEAAYHTLLSRVREQKLDIDNQMETLSQAFQKLIKKNKSNNPKTEELMEWFIALPKFTFDHFKTFLDILISLEITDPQLHHLYATSKALIALFTKNNWKGNLQHTDKVLNTYLKKKKALTQDEYLALHPRSRKSSQTSSDKKKKHPKSPRPRRASAPTVPATSTTSSTPSLSTTSSSSSTTPSSAATVDSKTPTTPPSSSSTSRATPSSSSPVVSKTPTTPLSSSSPSSGATSSAPQVVSRTPTTASSSSSSTTITSASPIVPQTSTTAPTISSTPTTTTTSAATVDSKTPTTAPLSSSTSSTAASSASTEAPLASSSSSVATSSVAAAATSFTPSPSSSSSSSSNQSSSSVASEKEKKRSKKFTKVFDKFEKKKTLPEEETPQTSRRRTLSLSSDHKSTTSSSITTAASPDETPKRRMSISDRLTEYTNAAGRKSSENLASNTQMRSLSKKIDADENEAVEGYLKNSSPFNKSRVFQNIKFAYRNERINPKEITSMNHLIQYVTGAYKTDNPTKMDFSDVLSQKVILDALEIKENTFSYQLLVWMTTERDPKNREHQKRAFPENFGANLVKKCLKKLIYKSEHVQSAGITECFRCLIEYNNKLKPCLPVNNKHFIEAMYTILNEQPNDNHVVELLKGVIEKPAFDQTAFERYISVYEEREKRHRGNMVYQGRDALIEEFRKRAWTTDSLYVNNCLVGNRTYYPSIKPSKPPGLQRRGRSDSVSVSPEAKGHEITGAQPKVTTTKTRSNSATPRLPDRREVNPTLEKYINNILKGVPFDAMFQQLTVAFRPSGTRFDSSSIISVDHLIQYVTGVYKEKHPQNVVMDLSHQMSHRVIIDALDKTTNTLSEGIIKWMVTKRDENNPEHKFRDFPKNFQSNLLKKCLKKLSEKSERISNGIVDCYLPLIEFNKQLTTPIPVSDPDLLKAIVTIVDNGPNNDHVIALVKWITDKKEFNRQVFDKIMRVYIDRLLQNQGRSMEYPAYNHLCKVQKEKKW